MIAQGQWTWQELVQEDESSHATLDELGKTLQARLDEKDGNVKPLDAVRVLRTMLMDEQGFVVGYVTITATNDLLPLLMDRVLERRVGTPITLAIIYKCVLARVGIQVEMVRLADTRLVVGLPDDQVFVDVFDTDSPQLDYCHFHGILLN